MCDNLKTDRIRCDACRTINLAKANITHPKPDMQVFYDKTCTPAKPCTPLTEHPLNPACIRICSKEEFNLRRSGNPLVPPPKPIPYAHGKLMWAVKTGILVGSLYFTYAQGVWGDQQDVTECIKRWQEYMRSINTRRPPNFDQCGKVVIKETTDSLVAPLYSIYKSIVTTSFSGVVKIPVLLKCAYVEYLKAIEKHEEELAKERKIRKRSKMLG